MGAAKRGEPVCTINGCKARIICFDAKYRYPIVALTTCYQGEDEIAYYYYNNGKCAGKYNAAFDLIMVSDTQVAVKKDTERGPIYYIRGVNGRGGEVIKELRKRGLTDSDLGCTGNYAGVYYYFFKDNGRIHLCSLSGDTADLLRAYGTELFIPEIKPQFKLGDIVLARDKGGTWNIGVFVKLEEDKPRAYQVKSAFVRNYDYCIPYECNESLLGTKKDQLK